MLIPIRPGDGAYLDHDGAVFREQNEQQNKEVAFYEIQATSNEIVFSIRENLGGLENPVITLHTQWGATDFDLLDDANGEVIVSEQSGFDTDLWIVEVDGRSGRFSLTNFETGNGVDGTQAAWLPYIGVADLET